MAGVNNMRVIPGDNHFEGRRQALHEPGIGALDVGLPALKGIVSAREIGQSGVRTKPVMLTMHRELASVVALCGRARADTC
jgi:DNA-binding NarL/FixJ family response regulator